MNAMYLAHLQLDEICHTQHEPCMAHFQMPLFGVIKE